MSEQSPNIRVSRGGSPNRRRRRQSSKRGSGGVDLPDVFSVVSGVVRGARTAWWAGLGVLSVVEEAGRATFDALVEKGASWQDAQAERAQRTVEKLERLANKEHRMTEEVEARIREEVDAVLRHLDVPRREDFDELRDRVSKLHAQIDDVVDALDDQESVESSG